MKRKIFAVILLLSLFVPAGFAEDREHLDWEALRRSVFPAVRKKDMHTKEAEYLKRIERDRIKEEYGRKIMDRNPSGYMTEEEYEKASKPQDKTTIDYGVPQVEKPYDMQYVPRPIYKLARYNDPPGTPDLSVKRDLFKTRQLNLPGITAPDFSKIVYPAVYYYPERGAVTCDLFEVPIKNQDDSAINKILKANIAHRLPTPILSTDKELTNSSAYRTLTPIDFSADSTKLLVKEKIGSSEDGIWQTNVIVYDFTNKTSYDIVEVRGAIMYYWNEYKGLNLKDKRWDIFPLGFSKGNPNRIMLTAYAYTGEEPVFLGVWSVDSKGSQSRLISLTNGSIEVAANGFKLVPNGVVSNPLVRAQEKNERKMVRTIEKKAKKQDRAEVKTMKNEMKAELKEVNKQYKIEQEDYKLMNKLKGTTSRNENIEKYEKLQEALNEKRRIKAEKAEVKQQAREQKHQRKAQKKQEKSDVKLQKFLEKRQKEIDKATENANKGEPEMNFDVDIEDNEE